MLQIRNAVASDIVRIMNIYRFAQEFMIETGNPTQWGYFYPSEEIIRDDIEKGVCKVVYDEQGIHGVFMLLEEAEPTYDYIEGGNWLNAEPYVTIHRIAGDGQTHGIFKAVVDHCKKLSKNIRIDTHADNKIMQHLVERAGFIKCGIIYVRDRSPRLAYHLVLE